MPKQNISFTLTKAETRELDRLAAAELRTRSAYLRKLIRELVLRKGGKLPKSLRV